MLECDYMARMPEPEGKMFAQRSSTCTVRKVPCKIVVRKLMGQAGVYEFFSQCFKLEISNCARTVVLVQVT